MADRFLTISEAEKFTGKSRSTLRRFIDGIVKAEKSPDRDLLLPGPDEAIAFHNQNQPFAWRISEELLRRQFLKPDDSATGTNEQGSGETGNVRGTRRGQGATGPLRLRAGGGPAPEGREADAASVSRRQDLRRDPFLL